MQKLLDWQHTILNSLCLTFLLKEYTTMVPNVRKSKVCANTKHVAYFKIALGVEFSSLCNPLTALDIDF